MRLLAGCWNKTQDKIDWTSVGCKKWENLTNQPMNKVTYWIFVDHIFFSNQKASPSHKRTWESIDCLINQIVLYSSMHHTSFNFENCVLFFFLSPFITWLYFTREQSCTYVWSMTMNWIKQFSILRCPGLYFHFTRELVFTHCLF